VVEACGVRKQTVHPIWRKLDFALDSPASNHLPINEPQIKYISSRSEHSTIRTVPSGRANGSLLPSPFHPPAGVVPTRLSYLFLSHRQTFVLLWSIGFSTLSSIFGCTLVCFRKWNGHSLCTYTASSRKTVFISKCNARCCIRKRGGNNYLCPITGSALSRLLLRDCCSSRGRGRPWSSAMTI